MRYLALVRHNGGLGTLGDDHHAVSLAVDLGQSGGLEGNLLGIVLEDWTVN
jgi:hypothetical protein